MKKNLYPILFLTLAAVLYLWGGQARSEYGDIVLDGKPARMKQAGVRPVVFPHWSHRIRFKCKVCHEEIFALKKGADDIYMADILDGRYCGKCHDGKLAWDFLNCDRCHSYVPDGEKEQDGVKAQHIP